MFRVSHHGNEIAHADSIEHAREIVRRQQRGTYDIDEIPTTLPTSGITSWAWGRRFRHPDGTVEDDEW